MAHARTQTRYLAARSSVHDCFYTAVYTELCLRSKTTVTNNNEASDDISAARQTYYSIPKHSIVNLLLMITVIMEMMVMIIAQ